MKKSKMIIFSAPSGAGKTTIVRYLLDKIPALSFSISATTRSPRGEEKNGIDYYFLTEDSFREKISQGEFVEFEEVYQGVYYGTLESELQRIWASGKSVLFDIDVVGGLALKEKFKEQALSIFVQPPSVEELERRLRVRSTDAEEKIKERVEKAKEEMNYASKFDIVLYNEDLQQTYQRALDIASDFLNKD